MKLIRADPLLMHVYLLGTVVAYRQKNQSNSKRTGKNLQIDVFILGTQLPGVSKPLKY